MPTDSDSKAKGIMGGAAAAATLGVPHIYVLKQS